MITDLREALRRLLLAGILVTLGGAVACYQPSDRALYPGSDVSLPDLGPEGDVGPDGGGGVTTDILLLYKQECEICHPQFGAVAGLGPELKDALRHHSRQEVTRVNRHGAGEMASLAERITDEQAEKLTDLLESLYGSGFEPPEAGDVTAGEGLFAASCGECHPDGGASEQLVPEIAATGGLVSEAFLDALLQRAIGTMPLVEATAAERAATIRVLRAVATDSVVPAADQAIFDQRCKGCHADNGRQRMRASVVTEGGFLSLPAIRTLCVDGQGEMPGVLPELSDQEALDLRSYMASVVPQRALPGEWPPRRLDPALPGYQERGPVVYATRCQSCHGPYGAGLPKLWPHLRDAGYLHSVLYLKQFTQNGGGEMPGFPELTDAQLTELAEYLEALSVEVREDGPVVPDNALFRQHCEGCHFAGGRAAGYVSNLRDAGKDISTSRLRKVLLEGYGSMPASALSNSELMDLVAFFQDGLASPLPTEPDKAAARAVFGSQCEECHVQGGLLTLGVPGVGSVMGRASSAFLADVVTAGLGWMPPIPSAVGSLASLEQGLRQAAAGQAVAPASQTVYDAQCARCHLDIRLTDAQQAVASPTVLTTVGGRLSPAFMDALLTGLGAMPAVPGVTGGDASLRAFYDEVAGAAVSSAGLASALDLPTSRLRFDALCGGCHQEGGLAEARLPKLAQKLRFLSNAYLEGFLAASDQYGVMPPMTFTLPEKALILGYCSSIRARSAPTAEQTAAYTARCAYCHPLAESAAPIAVPPLTSTGARLSRKAVVELSQRGIGEMVPAYQASGQPPTEDQVAETFPQLSWLATQQPKPYTVRPLDPTLIAQGKTIYAGACSITNCHAAGGPSYLQPQELDGLPYVPLEGLSAELLRAVTRKGLGTMTYGLSERDLPEPDLAAVVEYMLALGQGQNP